MGGIGLDRVKLYRAVEFFSRQMMDAGYSASDCVRVEAMIIRALSESGKSVAGGGMIRKNEGGEHEQMEHCSECAARGGKHY